MKKITITDEIVAPEGFEFDSDVKRFPVIGEWFLSMKGEASEYDGNRYLKPCYILKKVWEPEVGKLYKFWDEDESDFTVRQFDFFNEAHNTYHCEAGIPYKNIGLIDVDMIGK